MSPKEFKQWQQDMGWSAAEAARRLGKSADTISNYRKRGVPLRESGVVTLACEALRLGVRT